MLVWTQRNASMDAAKLKTILEINEITRKKTNRHPFSLGLIPGKTNAAAKFPSWVLQKPNEANELSIRIIILTNI